MHVPGIRERAWSVPAWAVAIMAIAMLFAGMPFLLPGGGSVRLEAPNVALHTLDGPTVALSDYRGRPLLLSFWATTCTTCVEDLPHWAALYRELAPTTGLEFVGVAMSYDPPNRVMAMARQRRLPYPIALDVTGSVAAAFGQVQVTPTLFLIAPDGSITQRYVGALDFSALRWRILDLVPAEAG